LGDDYKDVVGRATQEAKAEGWGEGVVEKALILTFSQREKELVFSVYALRRAENVNKY